MVSQFEEFEPEEELKDSAKYEGGIKQFGKDIAKYNELTAEEERKLFRKSQAGDMEARNKLITSGLKLILRICGNPNYRLDREELVGICISELVNRLQKDTKPSQRFDPNHGRLSAFTGWICRSTINSYFDNKKRTVGKNVPLEEWSGIPKHIEIWAHKKINAQDMPQLLAILPTKERELLASLFGINCPKRTLQELSHGPKISITQTWEIKQGALGKLKSIVCPKPNAVAPIREPQRIKRKDKNGRHKNTRRVLKNKSSSERV